MPSALGAHFLDKQLYKLITYRERVVYNHSAQATPGRLHLGVQPAQQQNVICLQCPRGGGSLWSWVGTGLELVAHAGHGLLALGRLGTSKFKPPGCVRAGRTARHYK